MVVGARLVAAFQSRKLFTSEMRIQVVINQVPHTPAIGGIGDNHLGGIHRSVSNTLFPKERSLLSFFYRVVTLQRTWKRRQNDRENKDVPSVFSLTPLSQDKSVASAIIGHEAALHLKNWVWFYKVKQMLFSSHFAKRCILLPKEVLVFSKLVWYISCCRTYVFSSILN
jgi:hypothetical protein